ncbi:uncharacterized protein LOC127045340 [Gopherus flavomarginatus]|uniref:uncharacterized protein LOC127045340 n=1 Tax=Gopherus flavomarginatus TaxID=286002 RepID=UPI0021CBD36A|nr:uncharacterized protein LOC127045340 [Gopherus flavomarginatus]
MDEDSAEGEDEEEEEEDELAESTQHSVLPSSQELFVTQTELPSQPSQATSPDSEAMEATSAEHFSSLPTPSRRLAQIRRRKKRTRDEMFSEIMAVTRNERAHLREWKDVVAKYRKDASEREDRRDARDERCRQEDQRWRDATLELLRDKMTSSDVWWIFRRSSGGHRVPLQPMFNHPQYSPCSMSSSPRRVRTRGGRLCAPAHSTPVDSPTKRLSLH